ncbi:MAG: hypothetical protein GY754_23290 [bacterium]|nr:hypothetical protein [bacterium]
MEERNNISKGLARRIKQHVNAKEHQFFAIVQPGFEETAKRELGTIGIEKFVDIMPGGVEFSARLEGCWKVNICSRTISRLLMRLFGFKADHFDRLQKKVREFPWELYLNEGMTVSFSIKARNSKLYHTGRIEEEFRKAISARLKEYGISLSFSDKKQEEGTQQVFIRFEKDICTVSLDTSGGLLYKRGNKQYVTEAVIRETTAALILHEANIINYDILLDPMCGAGTFSLEAAGIFMNQYPNLERDFIFKQWPGFRPAAYNHLKQTLAEEESGANSAEKTIFSSDIDADAVAVAEKNFSESGLLPGSILDIKQRALSDIADIPSGRKCLIVLNPPYGNRLNTVNVKALYREIGTIIREKYPQCAYAIISPGVEYEKIMSLPYDKKILFMNGGIKVGVVFKST